MADLHSVLFAGDFFAWSICYAKCVYVTF